MLKQTKELDSKDKKGGYKSRDNLFILCLLLLEQ